MCAGVCKMYKTVGVIGFSHYLTITTVIRNLQGATTLIDSLVEQHRWEDENCNRGILYPSVAILSTSGLAITGYIISEYHKLNFSSLIIKNNATNE